jgi:hypothetical protein
LIIGGGSVTISSTSSIGGDLIVGAGRLVLDAPVKGAVRIGGGDVIINSEISGPVWVQADTSLTFGPKAKVASEVKYKGRKDAVINEGASVTNLQFEKIEKKSMGSVKSVVGGAIVIQLIAAIIAGLVLIKIFPKRVKWLVGGIAQNPWMNLGLGFLGMVVIPMAVFVALITFVGYYLAFILMTWFILALMLACLVASSTSFWSMYETQTRIESSLCILFSKLSKLVRVKKLCALSTAHSISTTVAIMLTEISAIKPRGALWDIGCGGVVNAIENNCCMNKMRSIDRDIKARSYRMCMSDRYKGGVTTGRRCARVLIYEKCFCSPTYDYMRAILRDDVECIAVATWDWRKNLGRASSLRKCPGYFL